MPTYKIARDFKGVAEDAWVPLNAIAFNAVLSYLMGLCLVRTNTLLILIGIPVFLASSIFTGSRAPVAILMASILVWLCVKGLRSTSVSLRIATALLAAAAAIGGTLVVSLASRLELKEATEGRSELWRVGIEKFAERPVFGYGYDSWRDDLVSRLPGETHLTFKLAKFQGGGYHNEYISVLAEEGLIGAFGAALFIWLLVRTTWLLAFRKWATVQAAGWPLFAAIFLLLRANFEVPGLFGYGQDPVDYLSYLFVAVVMSRLSVEEDYARALAPNSTGVAA
jgi:O-antigen ligase